jgi:UDP-glucose 4-epimerase
MRVAITGAGGLLGGAVVKHMLALGYEVVALSGSLDTATDINVVRWDAKQDWQQIAKSLQHVNAIVHAGAHIPSDHNDASEAKQCFEVNALGTLNLLRACEFVGVQRFIYVSGANVLDPRGQFVQENDPIGCEYSPYYLGSKVLGEIYVRASIARGMSGLIVRPSSIYGPGMKSGVLWHFAERIKSSLPITLHSGGQFRADYVWRDDVAKLLSQAVTIEKVGVVNVGSGKVSSILDVANLLLEIYQSDKSLIEFSDSINQPKNKGFSPVDITRACSWFDFKPTSLKDGLVRWFSYGGI